VAVADAVGKDVLGYVPEVGEDDELRRFVFRRCTRCA